MAATDSQIVAAAARWADEAVGLRELLQSAQHPLPAVVKVVKGQHGGLGVPSLPCPGLHSAALLVSAGRRRLLAAQAVKVKPGRRLANVGPPLAIPDSYPGYFELLSEEGRAGRCIETVSELSRRRPRVTWCLVREPVRALLGRPDPPGGLTAEGARTLAPGEVLAPQGEVTLHGGRFLHCLDERGDPVLLGMEQRVRVSAVARPEHITGVHPARNLLAKRLPLTVRLVHGAAPRGLRSPAHFLPELRILAAFQEEEQLFAVPLAHQRDPPQLVAVPAGAHLRVLPARNADHLRTLPAFARLAERAARHAAELALRILVMERPPPPPHPRAAKQAPPPPPPPHDENAAPAPTSEYDEIDQIYDYVRGFCPPPAPPPGGRPEPPPVETIPGRKPPPPPAAAAATASGKAEKRTRPAGLFVKNAQRGPRPQAPPPPPGLRYRSLSNLAGGGDPVGTLGSSHTSGESGGPRLPPDTKRSRRLGRPRSLSNLAGAGGDLFL